MCAHPDPARARVFAAATVEDSFREAAPAEHQESGNILIAIRPNGDIWMDKRQVALTEVRGLIERLHVERPDDTVVLIADRDAQTGALTKVMDQVKLGGVKDVSIATAPSGG